MFQYLVDLMINDKCFIILICLSNLASKHSKFFIVFSPFIDLTDIVKVALSLNSRRIKMISVEHKKESLYFYN